MCKDENPNFLRRLAIKTWTEEEVAVSSSIFLSWIVLCGNYVMKHMKRNSTSTHQIHKSSLVTWSWKKDVRQHSLGLRGLSISVKSNEQTLSSFKEELHMSWYNSYRLEHDSVYNYPNINCFETGNCIIIGILIAFFFEGVWDHCSPQIPFLYYL